MLTSYSVKNYKAFKEAYIPIKPITIFIGANSVGKSSMIQLLLLLQQTSKEYINTYGSALKVNGSNVGLGKGINLYHRKITETPLEIGLSLKNSNIDEHVGFLLRSYKTYVYRNIFMFESRTKEDAISIKSLVDDKKFVNVINKYWPDSNDLEFNKIDSYFLFDDIFLSTHNKLSKDEIIDIYNFLLKLNDCVNEDNDLKNGKNWEFIFIIKYNEENQKLELSQFKLLYKDIVIFDYNGLNSSVVVQSDITTFSESDILDIRDAFSNSSSVFSCFQKLEDVRKPLNLKSRFLLKLVTYSLDVLRREFFDNKVKYVGPLRAQPQRYYILDNANKTQSLNTLDGNAIAEVLKYNNNLQNKVNEWLSKFNFNVQVDELEDVVNHLKVYQNELDLDISDVGFGLSQVLPIIIQCLLSKKSSLILIEQPEIHLHPQMQADLADLFIDIVKNKSKKRLIIETHSEYLLRRLRRRIAEGVISSNDVAICVFHGKKEDKDAYVETLNIEQKGNFKWPEEFYGGELYNDTIEFLKLQN